MSEPGLEPINGERESNRDGLEGEDLFSPWELYHENSKLRPSDHAAFQAIGMVNTSPEIQNIVARPRAAFPGYPKISLPVYCPASSGQTFEAIVQQRRSVREFSGAPISLPALSQLLHLGDGISGTLGGNSGGDGWSIRTAPSPGGLFPIDLYCVALRVEELESGLYFFNASTHGLEQIIARDFAAELGEATYLPEAAKSAAVCFALSGVFQRVAFKYGERAYRFALIEAGHIGQNLLLAAVAAGFGAVPIGGFYDDKINDLLQLDGCEEAALYLVLTGGVLPAVGQS